MALTATAQSALPPNPSWDEMIVPALRKRLENESRAISRRMSVTPIQSGDEDAYPHTYQGGEDMGGRARSSSSSRSGGGRARTPTSHIGSNGTDKPSAIPRPSLNYSRPTLDQASGSSMRLPENSMPLVEPKKQKPKPMRSRTYSQPYNVVGSAEPSTSSSGRVTTTGRKPTNAKENALPTPASSRSNSPALPVTSIADTKATPRPPKVANMNVTSRPLANGSASRHYLLTPEKSLNGKQGQTVPYSNDQYANSLSSVSVSSTSKHATGHIGTEIMYEMPPFSANSNSSSMYDDGHTDILGSNRPSAEEERPFEHWYRGDFSRNGGVGELRVGNRIEMLEIANYGHRLRQLPPSASSSSSVATTARPGRRRAESFGHRDSVVYEDDETMVLDEMPLTDMEMDTEHDTDRELGYSAWHQTASRQPSKASTSTERHTQTISTARQQESQIPRPTFRAASEPPDLSRPSSRAQQSQPQPSSTTLPVSKSLSLPLSGQKHGVGQKRSRTKSPAPKSPATSTPSTPSSSKKPKSSTVAQKRSKTNVRPQQQQASKAEYPSPAEDIGEMADAIPSWTQPVPKSGNWDEVVLPVVARKMGLEDQYREANGNQQPSKRESLVPPAPGTFGYDPSKRRIRHQQDGEIVGDNQDDFSEEIPMDEFGQYPTSPVEGSEMSNKVDGLKLAQRPKSQVLRRESPPPFSQYTRPSGDVPALQLAEPPQSQTMHEDETSSSGGCCKCVIM